jgi:hypothetical protein
VKVGTKAVVTPAFQIKGAPKSKLVGEFVEVTAFEEPYVLARFLTGPEAKANAVFGPNHAWAFLPRELMAVETDE